MAEREPDRGRGVYMISVAAELAGMHPQTLRIYESRGLITPKRSPKNTRLYSQEDVDRLRRIQELTGELGMNLAGVEKVFELEEEIDRMRRRMRNLERQTERVQKELGEVAASERELRSLLHDAHAQIEERDRMLDELRAERVRLTEEAQAAHRELRSIKRTRVFRVGAGWWRLRDRLRGRPWGG